MNCCGSKRKEWLNELKSSSTQKTIEKDSNTVATDKPDRVFEYTGKHSFTIHGVATGKSYSFKFNGDQITVEHMDAFAMMAERDLKILPLNERINK